MEHQTVRILLATYNGEAYIRQMIDSVLAQDYPHLHLVLSDDGSSDGTPAVLEEYALRYPQTVTHYRSGQRFGCAQKHFMHLLRMFPDEPYIMFCDQDDIWHPDKVRKTLQRMQMTEVDGNIPVLVHTDLRVVDRELREIASSFCAHSALDGSRTAFSQLLVQNVVTGCTVMLNRPLAQLACRPCREEDMRMHDWWLALLAAACGRIAFLPEATIDYRQHGANSVGAKNVYSPAYLLSRLRSTKMHKGLQSAAAQAEAFVNCYSDLLTEEQRTVAEAFASTKDAGLCCRNRIYLKYGLLKSGFIRRTAQLLGL